MTFPHLHGVKRKRAPCGRYHAWLLVEQNNVSDVTFSWRSFSRQSFTLPARGTIVCVRLHQTLQREPL
ncbi:hypothetical protein EYF80_043646 [Liparis tanakae]|uniref:Uncharacterized protein n=1 Tax=Liparis tanakae TaxID=230148 RepID=A0A4Z2FYS0_9TELE|nr:hypothetical protein EYF80_043646 [Liparis tanakae]